LPEGWRWGCIDEVFLLQRGFELPSNTRSEGLFPVISASGFHGYHSEFMIKAPGLTTGRSGVIGKVFLIQEDFWPLNTSLFVKEFRTGSPIFSYYLLKSLDLVSLNGGSAVPGLNRSEAYNNETIIPKIEVINHFSGITKPIFDEINLIENQSRTLTFLRDALLPRLMRGEDSASSGVPYGPPTRRAW
jgi:type I restriction enzyme S subunit